MGVVNLPGGGTVEIAIEQHLAAAAALPVLQDTDNSDAFKWNVKIGRPAGAAAAGPPAMSATFTLAPKGAPGNMLYGVKQAIFFKGDTAFYQGDASFDGSILASTTAANFTVMIDAFTQATATGLAAPTLPFFSSQPIAIANGAKGSIAVNDTPGGVKRIVRTNLVTAKRNFLAEYGSNCTFLTYAVAVLPDNRHFALEGFMWDHSFKARIKWGDKATPVLDPSGDVSFQEKLNRTEFQKFASLDFLERNDFAPSETVAFKVNNSMMTCEIRDAAMPARSPSQPKDDLVISQQNYSITHSQKQLL
jgi:hypothetical protein